MINWTKMDWEYVDAAPYHIRTEDALDEWRKYLCVEWNRRHQWYAVFEPGSLISVYCKTCPASIDDLYPDGTELIDGQVTFKSLVPPAVVYVTNGEHDAPHYCEKPVRLEVWSEHFYVPGVADEYDAGVTISDP